MESSKIKPPQCFPEVPDPKSSSDILIRKENELATSSGKQLSTEIVVSTGPSRKKAKLTSPTESPIISRIDISEKNLVHQVHLNIPN